MRGFFGRGGVTRSGEGARLGWTEEVIVFFVLDLRGGGFAASSDKEPTSRGILTTSST